MCTIMNKTRVPRKKIFADFTEHGKKKVTQKKAGNRMKNKIEEAKKSMPGKKLHLKNDKFN